jgi:hypothetical protein
VVVWMSQVAVTGCPLRVLEKSPAGSRQDFDVPRPLKFTTRAPALAWRANGLVKGVKGNECVGGVFCYPRSGSHVHA